MLYLHGIVMRPDWEEVVTPVVDLVQAAPSGRRGALGRLIASLRT